MGFNSGFKVLIKESRPLCKPQRQCRARKEGQLFLPQTR